MRNPFFRGVGGVLSADIAVPEHERELGFYAKALASGSVPLWRDDLTNNHGTPVIGLAARSSEYEALPLQWMPHIQVSDVATSAARTLELGGQELMHGKGDDGQSQWAVLVDPIGAAFGVVPVVGDESTGPSHLDRVGRISGLSLVVPAVSSTCEFYEQVVGWSTASAATDDSREMLRPNGVAAAAIFPMNDENEGIPSVWIISLLVDDLAESLRQVREITGAGHAVIRDPVGVYVALQADK
jgi:predicted enzyme related to lactoylglutathione lyase